MLAPCKSLRYVVLEKLTRNAHIVARRSLGQVLQPQLVINVTGPTTALAYACFLQSAKRYGVRTCPFACAEHTHQTLRAPTAPSAVNMARHHLLLVALGCCLLGPRLLVEATGRQPLTNTNTTRIFYGEQHCRQPLNRWLRVGLCSRDGKCTKWCQGRAGGPRQQADALAGQS